MLNFESCLNIILNLQLITLIYPSLFSRFRVFLPVTMETVYNTQLADCMKVEVEGWGWIFPNQSTLKVNNIAEIPRKHGQIEPEADDAIIHLRLYAVSYTNSTVYMRDLTVLRWNSQISE